MSVRVTVDPEGAVASLRSTVTAAVDSDRDSDGCDGTWNFTGKINRDLKLVQVELEIACQ
jgi:hypothetical protein